MDALRTPDERFNNLPDYAFAPNYLNVDDTEGGKLRMHYVDEGERDAPVVLLLHGEPSWSYLYRKMIGPIASAGFRVIAPDLIGFGRSDKPTRQKDYTASRHVGWVAELLLHLDLRGITLFCQDWGGLIGLRLVADHGDRFARVVAGNTMLPGYPEDSPALKAAFGLGDKVKTLAAFGTWYTFSQVNPFWKAGDILQAATVHKLSPPEVAAYNAPYPNRTYMAGAHVFPRLVPTEMAANKAAWRQLVQWQKPFLCAFSDKDPIMSKMAGIFPALIPGCSGQSHTTIRGGGHFLQDDQGEALAGVIINFIQETP